MKKDDSTTDLPGWEGMPPTQTEVEAVRDEPLKQGETVLHRRETRGERYEIVEVTDRHIALRNLRTERVHHTGHAHARRYLRRV